MNSKHMHHLHILTRYANAFIPHPCLCFLRAFESATNTCESHPAHTIDGPKAPNRHVRPRQASSTPFTTMYGSVGANSFNHEITNRTTRIHSHRTVHHLPLSKHLIAMNTTPVVPLGQVPERRRPLVQCIIPFPHLDRKEFNLNTLPRLLDASPAHSGT